MVLLVVPSDPLRPRLPDPHFAPEAAAARQAGWSVTLVDHDALSRAGGATAGVARVAGDGPAVYRGWMLRAEHYAAFAAALAARGPVLVTDPAAYRRAHELPGWYDHLRSVTPTSSWTDGVAREAFDRARVALGSGPAVLRDHCKSLKHHWDEAAYVPEVADGDAAWRIATRFVELRGEDLVGGLVLRRFERFVTAELRTWWVGGRCLLAGAHPDTPGRVPDGVELAGVAPLVAGLGLPFVTVDLVGRDDGRWRVVELGDGQVSDRPSSMEPAALVEALSSGLATAPGDGPPAVVDRSR